MRLGLGVALLFCGGSMLTQAQAQWSTFSLSTGRRNAGVAVTGGSLYVGGGTSALNVYSLVERVDLATNQVVQYSLSERRFYLAAAASSKRVYFAGGRSVNLGLQYTTRVDIFDEETNQWSIEELPYPRANLMAASLDGKIYFVGGIDGTSDPGPQVQIYDELAGTWSVVSLPARVVTRGAVVVTDEYLCILNGQGSSDPNDRTLDILHAPSGVWRHVLMPESALAASVVGDAIYIANCGADLAAIPRLDVYSISTGGWSTTTMPNARCGPALGSLGDYLVVANGHSVVDGSVYQSADLLDTTTGTWTTMPMAGALQLRDALTHERSRSLFVLGGDLGAPGLESPLVDVLHLSDDLGTRECSPLGVNSAGRRAQLRGQGTAAAVDNLVSLSARGLPVGSLGLFLVASEWAAPFSPPGSEGRLCLGGSIGRYSRQFQAASPLGRAALSLDLTALPIGSATAVQPGDTWTFQYWYRDRSAAGMATSNASDSLSIQFE